MKVSLFTACLIALTATASAETFQMKDEESNRMLGPFNCRHRAAITIAGTEYEVIRHDPRHNEILEETKKMVISEMEFRDANLKETVYYLNETCRRVGSPTFDLVLVNGQSPATSTGNVSLSIRKMSVYDSLNALAQMTGYQWDIRNGSIMLEPSASFIPPVRLSIAEKTSKGLFSLKNTRSGKSFGPYALKDGTILLLDEMILSLALDASDEKLVSSLNNLKLPSLDFQDAKLEDCVVYFNAAIKDLQNTPSAEPQILLADNVDAESAHLTISLRNKSLYDILGAVCEASGLQWKIQDGKVVLEEQ